MLSAQPAYGRRRPTLPVPCSSPDGWSARRGSDGRPSPPIAPPGPLEGSAPLASVSLDPLHPEQKSDSTRVAPVCPRPAFSSSIALLVVALQQETGDPSAREEFAEEQKGVQPLSHNVECDCRDAHEVGERSCVGGLNVDSEVLQACNGMSQDAAPVPQEAATRATEPQRCNC
jgi:hypothetical protein